MSCDVRALRIAVTALLMTVPGTAVAAPPEPTEQSARCARPGAGRELGVPAGHQLLDIATAHRFSRGAGVTVAVIDTGVTPHPRLPHLVGGGDFVGDGDGLTDCDLHGTLVAGIIAARPSAADGYVGVAPEARIISIRQSSGAYRAKRSSDGGPTVGVGYGPLATLATSIVAAVDLGADVITISEAACLPAGTSIGDGKVGDALRLAASRDVVVVVAAGNLSTASSCREQNPDTDVRPVVTVATPAHLHPLVLTVGATTADDGSAAEFSLRGPWVSVGAPGTDIVGLAPSRGPITSLASADGDTPLAGTSFAAPYVAGTAALVRSRFPDLSARGVIDRILATAHGGGRDTAVGRGLVDPVAALTAHVEPGSSPTPRAIAAPAPPADADGGPSGLALAVGVAALASLGGLLRARRAPATTRNALGVSSRSGMKPEREATPRA